MNESSKDSESEEVQGFGEDKIPVRNDLFNSIHEHLDSEENSRFECLTEKETKQSASADQIEKELRRLPNLPLSDVAGGRC